MWLDLCSESSKVATIEGDIRVKVTRLSWAENLADKPQNRNQASKSQVNFEDTIILSYDVGNRDVGSSDQSLTSKASSLFSKAKGLFGQMGQ